MQPVKLTIGGQYWDSQIYMGLLYLFVRDGSLLVVNWDRLIGDLARTTGHSFAVQCSLRRSDYLYEPAAQTILSDLGVRDLVIQRFQELAATELHLEQSDLKKYLVQHSSSPSPFPHADSTLYNSLLYTVGRSGVYCAPCQPIKKGKPIGFSVKRWDGSAVACTGSYNTLALAAGDSGLFGLVSGSSYRGKLNISQDEPRLIVNKDCTDCSWNFFNIFGTSREESSFLVQYKMIDDDEHDSQMRGEAYEWGGGRRVFDRIIDEQELFGVRRGGYEIAFQDKFYRIHDNAVSIIKSNPNAPKEDRRLISLGDVPIEPWKGRLVSAKVAVFGVVLELDNALVILGSDPYEVFESHTIPGEPVNWRVFPRSANYRNHLHVVRNECLDVLSFNQDYFVVQRDKRMGTRYSAVAGRRAG